MYRLVSSAKLRDTLTGAALLGATAALLAFPKETIAAAKDGLLLCYNVIIPSLFPFFVLSSLVVALGFSGYLGHLLEGIMRPLFGVSGACSSAFVLGFIGGYPIGAKTAIHLYENKLCSKTEAERLLAFCNNSGPAFILGVVGAGVFASSAAGLLLYFAHALASVCVGMLFRFYKYSGKESTRAQTTANFQTQKLTSALTDSIKGAFSSTLNICAFVVFFTVVIRLLTLSGFLSNLGFLLSALLAPVGMTPQSAERLLTGAIEISSGVWTLSEGGGLPGRLSMAAFMLGFAGISVHCQVLSFVGESGLSVRTYLAGKTLHGLLSALLITVLTHVLPMEFPVSSYLAEQVSGISGMDFHSSISISITAAWSVFLCFLGVALYVLRKRGGNRTKNAV